MNRYLDLRTRMLVTEFGKKRVLEALATIEGVDLHTVERELAACQERKRTSKVRRRKSVPELLDQARVRADIRPALERVALAYESRQFLPDLSKVRNFLGERGVDPSKLRSRADALPKVIGVLARESADSLECLLASSRNDRGDLGILADHILGDSRGNAKEATTSSMRSQ
ncbi:MAG: hypothetical protein OXJ53_21760 [Gammaproteobacteria bacterium]|nr:hypothetical protein [Gammaproteobacteria bacterium]